MYIFTTATFYIGTRTITYSPFGINLKDFFFFFFFFFGLAFNFKIFTKLLEIKPEHIYNIDEKGLNTEYRPQNIVAAMGYQPQVVMENKTKSVTVIGAGNAVGSQVHHLFFIFPGQRMMPELMEGQTSRAAGTVTSSGWSYADVSREYLQDHFMKYVQGRDSSESILILYDGYRSHLFRFDRVVPPHRSHILQPMDDGYF